MENLEVVMKWWQFLLMVAGFGIAVGKLYQKVKSHDEILKKVIDADKIVRRYLFDSEGQQIYTPRMACNNLQTRLYEQLESLGKEVSTMSKSIAFIRGRMGGREEGDE